MSRRVQFDRYGPVDVLHVAEVPRPSAGEGQVLIEVAAAGINPGEIANRNGAMEAMFPATFLSGQGSDFAGRVVAQRHAPKTDASPQVSDPDILATMAEHVAGHGSRRLADCAGVAWL
jgi:NADPH:quinone reductase-like Zn-dependent oxidoreductase